MKKTDPSPMKNQEVTLTTSEDISKRGSTVNSMKPMMEELDTDGRQTDRESIPDTRDGVPTDWVQSKPPHRTHRIPLQERYSEKRQVVGECRNHLCGFCVTHSPSIRLFHTCRFVLLWI